MTYPAATTFWLERTEDVAWGLRRYARTEDSAGCPGGYHQSLTYLGVEPATYTYRDGRRYLASQSMLDHADPRWPAGCVSCAYLFLDADHWQMWQEGLYRRADTGQLHVLHQSAPADALSAPSAPPGASWDAWWMGDWCKGPDGMCLMVRLPNGRDWMVDSEASNCTRKGDRSHKCWVRDGDPRLANVTAGKSGGDTCAAGAGSIQAGDYHGFLNAGVLSAG